MAFQDSGRDSGGGREAGSLRRALFAGLVRLLHVVVVVVIVHDDDRLARRVRP